MSRSVIEQFGKQAEEYFKSTYHSRGKDLQTLVEFAQPGCVGIALDLATGAGHTAFAVAKEAGRVFATDITPRMLDRARAAALDQNVTNVEFALCDAEAIPFSEASFDLVTCRAAPHHFHHVDQAVQEAFRVVKPGGCVVIIDGAAPEDPDLHQFLDYIEKVRDPTHNRRLSLSEWRSLFRSTGFVVEHCGIQDDVYDFDWWMNVAGVKEQVREQLEDAIINATPEQHAYFRFEIRDGRVMSLRNDRAVIKGRKPGA